MYELKDILPDQIFKNIYFYIACFVLVNSTAAIQYIRDCLHGTIRRANQM